MTKIMTDPPLKWLIEGHLAWWELWYTYPRGTYASDTLKGYCALDRVSSKIRRNHSSSPIPTMSGYIKLGRDYV